MLMLSSRISPGILGRAGRWKFDVRLLAAVFLVLGVIYTMAVPLFESPDEPWHYNYVRYVAQGRGLPSLADNESGAYQEVGQPPLYYLAAALATAPVRTDDLRSLTWHNPGFGYQAPGTVNDNKNLMIHTDREAFPWRGAALAIHLARLVSLVFGALAVVATWGLAHEVFPDSAGTAMAAAALVAATPQFVFMSSVASNDSSAAALSTAALWAVARIVRLGVTRRRAALAGVLVGLASLTKTSTILLGVVAVGAILVRTLDYQNRKLAGAARAVRAVATLTACALAVGGWWYVRNGIVYGDALGLGVHLNTPWARPQEISILSVLPLLPTVYRSFWGAFGWGNVEMPAGIYAAITCVIAFSLTGWFFSFFPSRRSGAKDDSSQRGLRTRQAALLCICFLWCSAIFVSFLRWNQQVEAPHGRLLFPMIGALAVLLVGGLAHLPRPHMVLSIVAAGFLALSVVAPFVFIRPAYARPELAPTEQIRNIQPAVSGRDILYGSEARLIGFALDRPSVSPGEWLNVTCCWTARQAMTRDYTVFVHLLGRENLVVGARTTYPALGRFPTSLWPVGRAFCETIPVRVEEWAPVPELYGVEVGLYDAKTNDRLEATDLPSGSVLVPPVVGQVRVAPARPLRVEPQHATQADYGAAALVGFDAPERARPGEPARLRLYWHAKAPLSGDYTVFVHLLDSSGQLAAQADSEPRRGAFPTSAWVAGDVVPDDHVLDLPAGLAAGEYSLRVGLYLSPDGPRLPLRSPLGDTVLLSTLRIER